MDLPQQALLDPIQLPSSIVAHHFPDVYWAPQSDLLRHVRVSQQLSRLHLAFQGLQYVLVLLGFTLPVYALGFRKVSILNYENSYSFLDLSAFGLDLHMAVMRTSILLVVELLLELSDVLFLPLLLLLFILQPACQQFGLLVVFALIYDVLLQHVLLPLFVLDVLAQVLVGSEVLLVFVSDAPQLSLSLHI